MNTLTQSLTILLKEHQADVTALAADEPAVQAVLTRAMTTLLAWRAPTTPDWTSGQAIFAFAFGQGPKQTPGGSNLALAAQIRHLLAHRRVPLFAQWEVAEVLQESGQPVDFTATPQAGYLSTRGVLAQFRDAWQQRGRPIEETTVILVAHPDHQVRCHNMLSAAGFSVIVPDVGPHLAKWWAACGCDAHGYDPASAQPWTRNRAAFVAYELSIRFDWLRNDIVGEVDKS